MIILGAMVAFLIFVLVLMYIDHVNAKKQEKQKFEATIKEGVHSL